MPTFIKTGLWEKVVKGYKGWLNLDDLIVSLSSTIPGPQGPIGPQGPQGVEGPQGIQGETGAALTVLGSYPDLAAFQAGAGGSPGEAGQAWLIESDGSLYIWNTATNAWEDVGDLQGPQGLQGIQGVQGEQGIQGPQGIQGIQGIPGPTTNLYSATFFDSTLQTNGGATTANQVVIGSTQAANGFTLGPDNRINITNAGIYFISALFQLSFTGGASNYNVTVWYTINDAIVPNSAFTFTTTGAQNDQTLANITDTIAITAGQYIKFYWWSQATGMRLLPTVAGSNPTRPASPSVNISIFNVG